MGRLAWCHEGQVAGGKKKKKMIIRSLPFRFVFSKGLGFRRRAGETVLSSFIPCSLFSSLIFLYRVIKGFLGYQRPI